MQRSVSSCVSGSGPRRGRADQIGDQRRPAGLMAGAQARAVVAVEIFVERDVVAPVGIGLEQPDVAEDRAAAGWIAEKDLDEPASDLVGGLVERDSATAAAR